MEKFPGKGKTYLSADTVAEDDLHNAYPKDFLNSITLFGMPPHSMTFKVGAPVILLRNLRAGSGNDLCNGTRLIILKFTWRKGFRGRDCKWCKQRKICSDTQNNNSSI